MAAIEIEQTLVKTSKYINSDSVSAERAGHHNYVIIQKMINVQIPVNEMTKKQLDKFDCDCVIYLKNLDIPEKDR